MEPTLHPERISLSNIELGKKYGRLTANAINRFISKGRHRVKVLCTCDCGNTCEVNLYSLGQHTLSCGCYQKEKLVSCKTIHGKCDTTEFGIWSHMRARVNNPNNKDYVNYGGRGITIDKAFDTFEGFFAVLGPRPEGMTLDRIDVNKGYEPGNVRWANWTTQQRNRRNNRRLLYLGREITMAEAEEISGRTHATVVLRLSRRKKSIFESLGKGFSWIDDINPYTGNFDLGVAL